MKEPIFEVNRVKASLEGNEVVVAADGQTRTSGWTDPELAPLSGSGDTLTYEFVATPPGGISNPVLTPISATTRTGPLLPPFPTHVVVRAETNEIRVPIESSAYAPPPASEQRPTV